MGLIHRTTRITATGSSGCATGLSTWLVGKEKLALGFEHIIDIEMHEERYIVGDEAASKIASAGRVVAIVTTVVRTLESVVRETPRSAMSACSDDRDIFINPPYEFGAVDALLTNFHLPKSTLLMLVSAFAGKNLIAEAYHQAVAKRYRFFSYGDCMLIL